MKWIEIVGESEVHEDSLNELFDSSAKFRIDVNGDTRWEGSFKIGEVPYGVSLTKFNPESNSWELVFGIKTKYAEKHGMDPLGNTGTGSSLAVFGTVINAVRKFVAKKNPDFIVFTGDKSTNKDALYTRMLKRLVGELTEMGYTYESKDFGGLTGFVIRRNDVAESYNDLAEHASAGGSSAGGIAAVPGALGAGFDPNGDHGIYQSAKKKTKQKGPIIIRR